MHLVLFALIGLGLYWACFPTGSQRLAPNHHALCRLKIGYEGKGGVDVPAHQFPSKSRSVGCAVIKVSLLMAIVSPYNTNMYKYN